MECWAQCHVFICFYFSPFFFFVPQLKVLGSLYLSHPCISRVSDQNGVSLLNIMLEIYTILVGNPRIMLPFSLVIGCHFVSSGSHPLVKSLTLNSVWITTLWSQTFGCLKSNSLTGHRTYSIRLVVLNSVINDNAAITDTWLSVQQYTITLL